VKRITRPLGRLLSNKWLWRILFVPMVLVAGLFAWNSYTSSQNSGVVQHVRTLDQGSAQQVQADMQAWMAAGKPVFFELCSGDICNDQVAELDKVAAEYKDRVMFVRVNPRDVPDLAQAAATAAGQAAYPTHFIVGSEGEFAEAGLYSAEQLKTFIDQSLGSSNVVRLTASNQQQVQQQTQGKSVLYVVCSPDLCKMLTPALEQTATAYKGKVVIVMLDITSGSPLVDAVAETVGGYIYPAYVFVNSNGGMLPYAGLLGPQELTQLIEAGLKAPVQPADAGAPSATPAPGTAPATPVPGSGS
jgi:thiol-disulfide isomerase/thioredoxin